VLAVFAVLVFFMVDFGGREAVQKPHGPTRTNSPSPAPPEELLTSAVEALTDEATGVTARAPEERVDRLVCLRGSDREPIAGISIFIADLPVCGPSRKDGVLEFVRGRAQSFTVWGEGWVPFLVRRFEGTPETVLLEEAAARLEVRLLNLDPGDEIVRTLLQPHAFQVTGKASWEPVLASTSPDRLAADGLPPGTYDVYVWVVRLPDPPRCLSAAGILIEGLEPAVIELDAGAPPEPDPDS